MKYKRVSHVSLIFVLVLQKSNTTFFTWESYDSIIKKHVKKMVALLRRISGYIQYFSDMKFMNDTCRAKISSSNIIRKKKWITFNIFMIWRLWKIYVRPKSHHHIGAHTTIFTTFHQQRPTPQFLISYSSITCTQLINLQIRR